MPNPPTFYGFNYRFKGRNYAIGVSADSEEEAAERVKAMSAATMIAQFVLAPSFGSTASASEA